MVPERHILTAAILCAIISICLANPTNGNEIEARRRSVLDKNFLRFGRNSHRPTTFLEAERLAAADNSRISRELTKRNNNFLRFGRNDNLFNDDDQFIEVVQDQPQRRSTNSFLRFGRNMLLPIESSKPQVPNMYQPEELLREDDSDIEF